MHGLFAFLLLYRGRGFVPVVSNLHHKGRRRLGFIPPCAFGRTYLCANKVSYQYSKSYHRALLSPELLHDEFPSKTLSPVALCALVKLQSTRTQVYSSCRSKKVLSHMRSRVQLCFNPFTNPTPFTTRSRHSMLMEFVFKIPFHLSIALLLRQN